jgi:hypothetical protein
MPIVILLSVVMLIVMGPKEGETQARILNPFVRRKKSETNCQQFSFVVDK